MAGGNKRRLSRGGGAKALLGGKVADSDSDESDMDLIDEVYDKRDSTQSTSGNGSSRGGSRGGSSGRRRSSFGGARFANADEQARVVSMYTNIIKLSSENKINDKNSWNLDLIDNMGKLLKDDSRQQRGVNFQKASCTLDASVKIYSHRVDDTYTTSHRVLESFSRNQLAEEEDEEEGEGEGDGLVKKRAARVGSRRRAGGAANTIEKNVDNINAKEIENEAQIDPIFQTMSKLFDKGGVHGMLMHNLRCVPHMAGMALSADGLIDPLSGLPAGVGPAEAEHVSLAALKEQFLSGRGTAPTTSGAEGGNGEEPSDKEIPATMEPFVEDDSVIMDIGEGSVPSKADTLADLVDITAWVREIDLSVDALEGLTVSPQFDAWREAVGSSDSAAGVLNSRAFAESAPTGAEGDMAMDVEGGVNEPEEGGNTQTANIASNAALECMRSSSALQPGFYDVSCLPFEGMSEDALARAKMRRTTALLSATSSSSSTMYDVMGGHHTSQGSAVSDPSPDESGSVGLNMVPETQECYDGDLNDNNQNTYDDSPDDADDDSPFDQFAGIENEADDCDEDGNYISSLRRESMVPPLTLQSSAVTDSRRSILGEIPSSMEVGNESSVQAGKIDWSAVNGEAHVTSEDIIDSLHEDEEQAEAMIDGLAAVASAAATGVTGAEYAYFDVETVAKNNNWAGAKHWKWGAAKAKQAVASTTERELRVKRFGDSVNDSNSDCESTGEEAGAVVATKSVKARSGKSKASKQTSGLDFTQCLNKAAWDKESLFAPPKSVRSDTTCMTAAALEKSQKEAEAGELFLPKDEKVEARDMCRLFGIRTMIVPPVLLRDLVIPKSMQSGNNKAKFARDRHMTSEDTVWTMDATLATSCRDSGASARAGIPEGEEETQADDFGNNDDYDDVDYDDDRFFGAGGTDDAPDAAAVRSAIGAEETHEDTTAAEDCGEALGDDETSAKKKKMVKKASVFDIDESKLIKLDREVEKINIGYSVIPKKVNVKQLKVDIWDQVATLAGVSREGSGANSRGEHDDENEPPPQDFHATLSSKVLEKTSNTTMSFQSLVNTVAKSQKQKEVTLSFYFICLLHLANEKTLKITDDKAALDELIVSGDSMSSSSQGE